MNEAPPADATPAPATQPPAVAAGAGRPRDVFERLAAAPWQWDFFHALRLIDAQQTGKPRLGTARRPADESLRLGQGPDLSFAPAALSAVDLRPAHGGPPRVEVRFFGLFGPNGPLPLHMTAYARERVLHKGDHTLVRFADMFHHRLLLLFYRAWAQAQPAASMDRPEDDRFADFVGSLIGIGGAEWRDRDALPAHAKLFYAGPLSRQVRNADGLQAMVAGYLRVPVRVQSFVGRWMRLLPQERTRIGRRGAARRTATAQLGTSAVLGAAVFDRQHHFRLHLGPLDPETFDSLLPIGGPRSALPALKALVDQYIGHEFGWDLQLELNTNTRPPSRLGRQGRLGWTTWIGLRPQPDLPFLILDPNTPFMPLAPQAPP